MKQFGNGVARVRLHPIITLFHYHSTDKLPHQTVIIKQSRPLALAWILCFDLVLVLLLTVGCAL